MSVSTPAQRSAVAPPGRRERADKCSRGMPVVGCLRRAAQRRALVTNWDLMLYHRRCFGWSL